MKNKELADLHNNYMKMARSCKAF